MYISISICHTSQRLPNNPVTKVNFVNQIEQRVWVEQGKFKITFLLFSK